MEMIRQVHSPGDDETWRPQEAVAKITNGQIDGHELMRPQLFAFTSHDK